MRKIASAILAFSIISCSTSSKSQPKNIIPNEPSTITVATWNIYKGRKNGWEEQLIDLKKSTDFLAIQEAWLTIGASNFFERYMPNRTFAKSFTWKGSDTGVMTISDLIPTSKMIFKSPFTEPISNTPKMSLLTMYDVPNGPIVVINMHAMTVSKFLHWKYQLEEIAGEIKSIATPIVFMGDFNDKRKKRREYLNKFFQRQGFEKVDVKTKKNIDHIYVKKLKVLNKGSIEVKSSDHPIIWAELQIKE